LTLTAPAINAAANVDFLVTGSDKASAVASVIEGPLDTRSFPAQLIQPPHGNLNWFVDAAAASRLTAGSARKG
jgi:6-phosphogluconolactonase